MELKLTDEQWCVMDLLMRAREKGLPAVSRTEIVNNSRLTVDARIKLTWAALTMPKELVQWVGHHEFSLTKAGIQAYELKFGKNSVTVIADSVICLPDQTRKH